MFYSPQILPKIYKPFFKEEFTREDLELHIAKEIETQPQFQAFISKYSDSSRERFVTDYAKAKSEIILELNDLRDEVHGVYNDFTKFASERIWDIQQKKLFDLQCKWRAEQITIPEIESTWDFKYWERDIKLCTFISPISANDIELYRNFLENSTEDYTDYYDPEWQSYDDFTPDEDGNESDEMPQWYGYHNNITGNGALLSLPDVRGEKEEFYNDIWRRDFLKAPEEETKPYFYFSDDEDRELFFNEFETKQFVKNYNEYHRLNELIESEESIEDAVRFLLRWHEEIPIKENHDWRKAIIEAKRRFINIKTAEALSSVYDEYKMRQDLSLPHQEKPDITCRELMKKLAHNTLDGRRLNGEPEDFNF